METSFYRGNRALPILSLLLALLLLALWTPPVNGQEVNPTSSVNPKPMDLKLLSIEDLAKLELTTVTKESMEAFKTPAAISVLTREDIARSGATNLPDLLRLVPGVEVAQISSDKWAIGIRGFEGYLSKSVLVLIDGRSVYTPLFAGVYWEMQDTLLEDIQRVEVIRGPGGTIWGSNSVNGVINIITRDSRETQGALVTASSGNVEQGAVAARVGAGDKDLAYRFWGKGFTRSSQFHPDGRNYDDWRRGQAGFRLDWDRTTRDNITISGSGYGMVAGSKLGINTYSPPALTNVEANTNMFGQNVEAAWRRNLSSGSDFQIRAYFDRTDRRDLNYREIRDTVDIDFIHHISGSSNDLIWGLGARVSPSRFFQTVPTVEFLPAKDTRSIFSGFVQDSIDLASHRVKLTFGSKLENNSSVPFEIQPSVRFAWTPSSKRTVWAAVTRAVRTPSRLEDGFRFSALAVPSLPLYIRLIGDGQFDSENLLGYELGYRTNFLNRGILSISTFYNSYDNLLSVENQPAAPEADPAPAHLVLPLFLRNGLRAQTRGGEIASIWDVTRWWRLKPSYSYMKLTATRKATSDDASSEKQLEGDSPSHKLVVLSLLTLPHGLNVDLTYRYVSAIPDQKIPAYSTGDIRIAKNITHELEFAVVGRNLMAPHHPEYGSLPGAIVEIRRSAYLKLIWTR